MAPPAARAIVAPEIHDHLGASGLSEAMNSLYSIDCQTCGRGFAGELPALYIDATDDYVVAALNHQGCKPSGINRAVGGILIVTGSSGPYLTWRAQTALVSAPRGSDIDVVPMLLLNPSLEQVFLDPVEEGVWRVAPQAKFTEAGFRAYGPGFVKREPVPGARATVNNRDIAVTINGMSGDGAYSAPAEAGFLATARRLRGVAVVVTHAVDPGTTKTLEDLRLVLAGDRTVFGWVELRDI